MKRKNIERGKCGFCGKSTRKKLKNKTFYCGCQGKIAGARG